MRDDGKYVRRFSAKPSGGLCAVLPVYYTMSKLLWQGRGCISCKPSSFLLLREAKEEHLLEERERGKENPNKSRHSPLPLLQSVFLSGLSFPSTSTSSPLADFYFLGRTLKLSVFHKSKSRQSGGKLRKGSAEGKTKGRGRNTDFFSIVLHYVSASESSFSVPMRVSELASDPCLLPLPLVSPLHELWQLPKIKYYRHKSST